MTKKKKNSKRYLGAVFLGALVVGGGLLAMPLMNADDQMAQIQENLRVFEKNPDRFLQTQDLGLKGEFENFNEGLADNFLEREASNSVDEGALEAALEAEDYEDWKEALQNLNSTSIDVVSEEDFKVLVSLNKLKPSETEETD